ncbi:uncharacterized protein LTR77_004204 [Saxophila tyrrhenica]|uniref:Uncharacterized protein n=1 Tax=Saxophila tyrrhenica TaxID=1690608 RepID=A0AAV9PCT7_9PEZI|nr:hypothetical protein LTR77_004204 [Saxophila tyrrhenica]
MLRSGSRRMAVSFTMRPQTESRLFTLPAEVRIQIYTLALTTEGTVRRFGTPSTRTRPYVNRFLTTTIFVTTLQLVAFANIINRLEILPEHLIADEGNHKAPGDVMPVLRAWNIRLRLVERLIIPITDLASLPSVCELLGLYVSLREVRFKSFTEAICQYRQKHQGHSRPCDQLRLEFSQSRSRRPTDSVSILHLARGAPQRHLFSRSLHSDERDRESRAAHDISIRPQTLETIRPLGRVDMPTHQQRGVWHLLRYASHLHPVRWHAWTLRHSIAQCVSRLGQNRNPHHRRKDDIFCY